MEWLPDENLLVFDSFVTQPVTNQYKLLMVFIFIQENINQIKIRT